jgi:hypothetical protein
VAGKRITFELPEELEDQFTAFAQLNGFTRPKAAQKLVILASKHHLLSALELKGLQERKRPRSTKS